MRAARLVPLLAGVLMATSLTACSSQTDTYCSELRSQKPAMAHLAVQAGRPHADVLGKTLQVWQDLKAKAPGDIADEWATLVFALQGLVEAFHAAGTTPAQYNPDSPPAGVTPAESKRLQDAAAMLASERVKQAGEAVEQHAKDVCQVDLGLSAGGA